MAVYIKEINIKNFRSIEKLNLDLNSQMNIFVGLNDVGKSNVLKALNLFFNNETDYGEKFNFKHDFCKFAKEQINQADEIEISILLHAEGFRAQNEAWFTKTWRQDTTNPPAKISHLLPRSKMQTVFDRIRYHYIPAVKGNDIFKTLLSKLYSAIPVKENNDLIRAANKFSKQISEYTKSLSKNILNKVDIESVIQIPDDMQNMFQALTFNTMEKNIGIPLDFRGDGIKARHIPSLLKFISESQRNEDHKGKVNTNIIWGYEEPENGVELLKCFEMAQEFLEYSKNFQIFITTHSPGFYSVGNNPDVIINKSADIFFVKRNEKNTEIHPHDNGILDESMGFMPLIAPYLQEKVKEIGSLKSKLKELNKNNKIVFVSGVTDEQYFIAANELFNILPDDVLIKNIGDGNAPGDRGGDGALDIARKGFRFINDNPNKKVIFVYDCDAQTTGSENTVKIKQNNLADRYKIGIENLLALPNDFNYNLYYKLYDDKKGYGGQQSVLDKKSLCKYITDLPDDKKRPMLNNFESVLNEINQKLENL